MDIFELTSRLFQAKEEERQAKLKRMNLEDAMAQAIGIPENWEGAMTNRVGQYKVRVSRKKNVRIDAEKLIECAAQASIKDQLKTLFRWKPEINKAAWDEAGREIITALSPAIESSLGKAAFSVEIETKNKNN